MKLFRWCAVTALCGARLFAQNQVDSRLQHERILAVVPLIGAGTYADPKRPLFAPAAESKERKDDGIIEYSWKPSDDGRYAIVEFVARDRKSLAPILSDPRTLKSFEKGKAKREEIERELKIYQKDFSVAVEKRP